ncbi:LytTR family DNA-binding domain-containing protein [Mucilaginibacter sabulilitoris]|uniref:LytTR family DNA-binding domain-containing protein n=1 Tax=Mucilaginibacter sabulilitoris TaxID=1173583 RepID=A0ABZ0TG82_9SPHI|nr:LytTR family DNA-binding domain-containing protein [Mucilaginibacter sabulilitoris]WPU91749.1 LytTR family DNA-binding domain-containing protein [Mucilaginibacter sabulilitoris]
MNVIKKILIIEDEKLSAERIKRLILEIRPNTEIVGMLPGVKKTVDWLSENDCPDLIMMDVKLADGLSFEIFNLTDVKCPVIFTTAYDEYAVKAFKYNSVDYLLKPIEKEELEAALIKYENVTIQPLSQQVLIESVLAQLQPKEYRRRFLLPYRDTYRKINVSDIAFFFSNMNISYANLFSGEQIIVSQTLEILEQELEPKNFFRINRQYILHIDSIEQIHNFFNGKLRLKVKNCDDPDIIVSRTKAPMLKTWLDF